MSNKIKSFIKRILIFHFVFLFIFSKYSNLNKSIKDFSKRIKFIAKNIPLSDDQIDLLESKSKTIFMTIFTVYSFNGFLALMNISIGKHLTGIMTIGMAIIYCNPLTTIKKNFEKNNYQYHWTIYIPSLEFCMIFCLGFSMIISSFYFNIEDDQKIKIKKEVNQGQEINEVKEGNNEIKEKSD